MLVESTGADQKGAINVYLLDLGPSFVGCRLKNPNCFLTAWSLFGVFWPEVMDRAGCARGAGTVC